MAKSKKASDKLQGTVDFLYEAGMLAHTPRSGFFFLGSGEQSVAEHLNRTAYFGYALGHMVGNVNTSRIVEMCMFHDFAEARVSDLNYVHQKYTDRHEDRALADLVETIPFGNAMKSVWDEYHERKTPEAIIAKDADNLEWIMSLKEQADIGNKRALTWIPSALKRLKTKEAKLLGKSIMSTPSDKWWFGNASDAWWVNRTKK